jgi:gliding motility-associated-like protein/uncharacterized delta-60 repeat protein
MKFKILRFAFSILFILLFTSANAQNIFLDTSFNKTGAYYPGLKYLMNLQYMAVRAIAVDSEGKIVTVVAPSGSSNFFVSRFNADGTPDSNFGGPGDTIVLSFPNVVQVKSLLIQPDGKYLIGGHLVATNGYTDMIVIRLNPDGSKDKTFASGGIWTKDFNSTADSISKMVIQNSGAIIIAGTSDTLRAAGAPFSRMTVLRLTPQGNEDKSNFKAYFSPMGSYNENVAGLDILNDTIYAGASFSDANGSITNSIIKLLPNGKPAWSGSDIWSTSGRIDFLSGVPVGDLAVRPNGNIFIAGSYSPYTYLTKINSSGQNNTPNAYLQSGFSFRNLLLDKDGKIILCGQVGSSYNYAIKVDQELGTLDSTFGINGKLNIYGASNGFQTLNQIIFSRDRKLLMAGADAKNPYPCIAKVYIKPVIHILGKEFVLPKTAEAYKAEVPSNFINPTYTWTYTGKNVLYFTGLSGPNIAIFFTDSATSGTLKCSVTAGSYSTYEEKEITINPKNSNAYQLAKLQCPVEVTDCTIGYIDYFKLNSIENNNSGCSDNGYVDYTRSDFNDTLSAGGVYSAHLRIPRNGSKYNYAAIWIDYNNDGDFNNPDEFAGESYSSGDELDINNIILKNKEGYVGAKRLRVRSQPDSSFLTTASCPVRGGIGETEDYLIMITTQPTLEAPQIITPNEDGLNDYFVVRGINPLKSNKLTIFDRIGTLQFTTSSYENNWNGTDSKGDKLIQGTYYYVFTSDKETIKGFVEIRY